MIRRCVKCIAWTYASLVVACAAIAADGLVIPDFLPSGAPLPVTSGGSKLGPPAQPALDNDRVWDDTRDSRQVPNNSNRQPASRLAPVQSQLNTPSRPELPPPPNRQAPPAATSKTPATRPAQLPPLPDSRINESRNPPQSNANARGGRGAANASQSQQPNKLQQILQPQRGGQPQAKNSQPQPDQLQPQAGKTNQRTQTPPRPNAANQDPRAAQKSTTKGR